MKSFGVLPNFFRLSPETPEIRANLWGFAQFAYLDNPLPSLFKERLFVYLSRFCEARYCIARHVGFLVGLGHASGDARSPVQAVDEIVQMLQRPFLSGEQLLSLFSSDDSLKMPLEELPGPGSAMENDLFVFAGHVFLQTSDAPGCLDRLKGVLGEVRLQYLILLLSFVRTAHYWTKVHPELVLEEDIKRLLKTHEALADCVLRAPEVRGNEVTQRLLDELPSLRNQVAHATNLLAAIVGSSDDAIVSKSLDGIISSWNGSAQRMFGYTAAEAIGQHITLIVPADRRDEEATILARLRRGERVDHFETVRMRKDGTTFDISLTISPVKDAAGHIIGASKVARDVTEHKKRERALAEQARLLDLSTDAIFVRGSDNRITYWNKAAYELYGYSTEEAVGRVPHELLKTGFPAPLKNISEQLLREGRWSGELTHTRKDGMQIVVSSRWALDRQADGKLSSILETNSDITERKRLEEVVKESELSARLMQTQDEERRRIARELHDGVGQLLTVLKMNIAAVAKEKTRLPPSVARLLTDNAGLIQQISSDIRTVSYLLHPPLLDEIGLQSTLGWLIEGFAERSKITAKLEISAPLERMPQDYELCLFRIAQECLTNIHWHSGSPTAVVSLRRTSGEVTLEVKDEGRGLS